MKGGLLGSASAVYDGIVVVETSMIVSEVTAGRDKVVRSTPGKSEFGRRAICSQGEHRIGVTRGGYPCEPVGIHVDPQLLTRESTGGAEGRESPRAGTGTRGGGRRFGVSGFISRDARVARAPMEGSLDRERCYDVLDLLKNKPSGANRGRGCRGGSGCSDMQVIQADSEMRAMGVSFLEQLMGRKYGPENSNGLGIWNFS